MCMIQPLLALLALLTTAAPAAAAGAPTFAGCEVAPPGSGASVMVCPDLTVEVTSLRSASAEEALQKIFDLAFSAGTAEPARLKAGGDAWPALELRVVVSRQTPAAPPAEGIATAVQEDGRWRVVLCWGSAPLARQEAAAAWVGAHGLPNRPPAWVTHPPAEVPGPGGASLRIPPGCTLKYGHGQGSIDCDGALLSWDEPELPGLLGPWLGVRGMPMSPDPALAPSMDWTGCEALGTPTRCVSGPSPRDPAVRWIWAQDPACPDAYFLFCAAPSETLPPVCAQALALGEPTTPHGPVQPSTLPPGTVLVLEDRLRLRLPSAETGALWADPARDGWRLDLPLGPGTVTLEAVQHARTIAPAPGPLLLAQAARDGLPTPTLIAGVGLEIWAVQDPRPAACDRPLVRAWALHPDGTVIELRFCTPASSDPQALGAAIHTLLASAAPGEQTLALGPRRHRFEPDHLYLNLPTGYLASSSHHADFSLHSVQQIVPLGQRSSTLTLYRGGAPHQPPAGQTTRDGVVLGQAVVWHLWEDDDLARAEATGNFFHAMVVTADAEAREDLMRLAERIERGP